MMTTTNNQQTRTTHAGTHLEAAVHGDEDLLGRLVREAVDRAQHRRVHVRQQRGLAPTAAAAAAAALLLGGGQAEVDLLREHDPRPPLLLLLGCPALEGAEALGHGRGGATCGRRRWRLLLLLLLLRWRRLRGAFAPFRVGRHAHHHGRRLPPASLHALCVLSLLIGAMAGSASSAPWVARGKDRVLRLERYGHGPPNPSDLTCWHRWGWAAGGSTHACPIAARPATAASASADAAGRLLLTMAAGCCKAAGPAAAAAVVEPRGHDGGGYSLDLG